MTDCIRLLIADDHAVVRYGLTALMATVPDIKVVGEAADGEAAVQMALALEPDVIVLDLVMPRKDGLIAIQEIKAAKPEACILILTSFADYDRVYPAIKAGALGYLLKDAEPQALLEAIRAVAQGEVSMHPAIARMVVGELNYLSAPMLALIPDRQDHLTNQEMRVVRLIAQGLSNQEIAQALTVSERTVGGYVSSVLKKLQLASRTQAALYALREGWASL